MNLKMRVTTLVGIVCLILMTACNNGQPAETTTNDSTTGTPNTERIISLSGAISETLAELGLEKNIVGVDITSTYPPSLLRVAKVGHNREISPEAVMAQNPTLVLGNKGAVKPELIEQLKSANVQLILLDHGYSVEGAKTMISQLSDTLGLGDKKDAILNEMDADLEKLSLPTTKPKVLFIYARGAGTLMVAGDKTAVDAMIKEAGGENAVSGFEEFKPLTPEALVAANPDVILMFDMGLESLGGVDGLLAIQGMTETNAGKNKQVIEMEGQYLSGFGPRTGKALVELAEKLKQIQN